MEKDTKKKKNDAKTACEFAYQSVTSFPNPPKYATRLYDEG